MKGVASFSLLETFKQGLAVGCWQSGCRIHAGGGGLAQMNPEE